MARTVTVSLRELESDCLSLDTLSEAFGPQSLGILIVEGLPPHFDTLRKRVLEYASYLAKLPKSELDAITSPETHYNVGWSHGKEKLKSGAYDIHKGSFYTASHSRYVEKNVRLPTADQEDIQYHEYTAPSVWPSESLLPGFRQAMEELCLLITDVALLVARVCDRYAAVNVTDYEDKCLEDMVRSSITSKARLLHYFPPSDTANGEIGHGTKRDSHAGEMIRMDDDEWCAMHVDDGCLTGLTSALYVDESEPLLSVEVQETKKGLKALPSSPDPDAGLYIASRDSKVLKVNIPANSLAFQTGEALEKITRGSLKAVPHFVKAPKSNRRSIARNTLAVFMQPNLDRIVDHTTGTTFGEFVKEVIARTS